MATPTWPATLPQKLDMAGVQHTLPNNALRTSMEIGPAKARRRSIAAPAPIQGSMTVTTAQKLALTEFYADTLAEVGRFLWDEPGTSTIRTMRFTGAPAFASIGGDHWTATLPLEILG